MKRWCMQRVISLGLGAALMSWSGAGELAAAPLLDIGAQELEAGRPGQTLELFVSDSDDTWVAGLEFNIEVRSADGSAIGDAGSAPRITGVDLVGDTIFDDPDLTAHEMAVVSDPLRQQWTVDVEDAQGATGEVSTQARDGLIATVTFDTTGAAVDQTFQLLLAGLTDPASPGETFDTRFFGADAQPITIDITNGTITLIAPDEVLTAWIGGDGDVWSDAGNWDPDAVGLDVEGMILVFEGAGGTSEADEGAYVNIGGLRFEAGADTYHLQGQRLSFSDNALIINTSGNLQNIANALAAGEGGLHLNATEGGLNLTGAIDLDAGGLSVRGQDDVTLAGAIIGDHGLLINADADDMRVELTHSDNDYAGLTEIRRGTLVTDNNALPDAGAVDLTGGDGATWRLEHDETIGSLAGATGSVVDLGGSTLSVAGDADTTFAGVLTNSHGTLRRQGEGILTLNSANTYQGGTDLESGGILLGHHEALGTGDVHVTGDARLGASTDLAEAVSNAIAIDDDVTLTLGGTGHMTLDGVIDGSGGVRVDGDAPVTLAGENTYEGGTELVRGELLIERPEALGTGDVKVSGTSGLGGSALSEGETALTLSNAIDLADDAALALGGSVNLALSGELTGTGELSFAGDVDYDVSAVDFQAYSGELRFTGGNVTFGDDPDDPTRQFVPRSVRVDGLFGGNRRIGGELINEQGGRISPGDSIGTISVDENYIGEPGSELWIEVRGYSDEDDQDVQHADLLEVEGAATFQSSADGDGDGGNGNDGDDQPTASTIRVSQLAGDDVPAVAIDDEFEVVRAGGGIEVQDLLIDSQISGINFLWKIVSTGNPTESLILTAIQEALMFDELAAGADRNTRRIAAALASLEEEVGRDDELIDLLHEEFPGAVDADAQRRFRAMAPAIGPQAYEAAVPVTVDNVSMLNTTLSRYFAARRRGLPMAVAAAPPAGAAQFGQPMLASAQHDPMILAAALDRSSANGANGANGHGNDQGDDAEAPNGQAVRDPSQRRWNVIAQAVGVFDNQQTDGDRLGYRADSAGALVGADYEVIDDLAVGLSLSYLWTDVDLKSRRGDQEINTLRLGPYVSYSPEPWFVDASLTYGYHRFDTTRRNPQTGTRATSKHDGHDVALYVGGGYSFEFEGLEGFELTPIGSLQYVHLSQDGFRESGTGSLEVDSLSTNSVRTRLGVQVRHVFELPQLALVPEASVGWEREWISQDHSTRARFTGGGDRFSVRAGEPEANAAFLGLGLTALFTEQVSGFVRYEGLYHGDGDAHAFLGGVGLRF